MAVDAATIRKRIERLKATRASGVATVDYPERGRVTYRTIAEIDRAIAAEEADLAVLDPPIGTTPKRRVVVTGRSGF